MYRWQYELKLEVLRHYGVPQVGEPNKIACVLCGFSDIRALSIDHIDGDGAEHRRLIGKRSLYVWLRTNKYPAGFRTLCMNCQWIEKARFYKIPNPPKKIRPVSNNVTAIYMRRSYQYARSLGLSPKESTRLKACSLKHIKEYYDKHHAITSSITSA